MQHQEYKNHVRYYAPHHFIFYPVIAILLGIALYKYFTDDVNKALWLMIALLVVLAGWLSFMMRQHYALILQNRMVRLEMRLRYFQLTGKRLEDIEERISFGQLAALRFASNEELESLVQRTLSENLSPTQIKESIKKWMPDLMRV
ncbi:MAG: hypothetical protein IT249_09125 [Chitinophagaceae bacterium]|nr:hypothetical protein [Chitinophagaceae bacterium]